METTWSEFGSVTEANQSPCSFQKTCYNVCLNTLPFASTFVDYLNSENAEIFLLCLEDSLYKKEYENFWCHSGVFSKIQLYTQITKKAYHDLQIQVV